MASDPKKAASRVYRSVSILTGSRWEGGGVSAGCLGWDPDLEHKIRAGAIEEDSSLEEAISKLFVKTEDFIVQMSAPIGLGPVTPEGVPSTSTATDDSASA